MDDGALLLRAFASCGIIIATLAGIAWLVRRVREGGTRVGWPSLARAGHPILPASQRRLEVVERLALGPGCGIALVRCETREFVVGVGPGVPTLLGAFERPS